mmetsp:Transcript_14232/g.39220  ORF Transcript_14232/g.39220 Transcript_14232/m.39220 type:complete len:220 (+) Transcript_14232:573-1232(+)
MWPPGPVVRPSGPIVHIPFSKFLDNTSQPSMLHNSARGCCVPTPPCNSARAPKLLLGRRCAARRENRPPIHTCESLQCKDTTLKKPAGSGHSTGNDCKLGAPNANGGNPSSPRQPVKYEKARIAAATIQKPAAPRVKTCTSTPGNVSLGVALGGIRGSVCCTSPVSAAGAMSWPSLSPPISGTRWDWSDCVRARILAASEVHCGIVPSIVPVKLATLRG